MRRLLIIIGVLVSSTHALAAQQLTAVRQAPVRLLPSDDARHIGAVHSGERLVLLTEVNGYARVLLPNNSVGWVDSSDVRRQPVPQNVQGVDTRVIHVAVAALEPRTTPSLDASTSEDAQTSDVVQAGAPMALRDANLADNESVVVPQRAMVLQVAAHTMVQDTPTQLASERSPADAFVPDLARAALRIEMPIAHDSVPPAVDLSILPHPTPREEGDPACADIGRANRADAPVDTATDLLKNRVDDGDYRAVSFASVLHLPWRDLPRRRYEWSAAQKRAVAQDEGAAVSLDGYVVAWRSEGPEQTNCELHGTEWHDWHVWLVRTEAEASARDRSHAVIVEVTPRVRRLDASRFDVRDIERWAREGRRVRVSGWLLLDPDHPDQVGKTRGTTWEIHPVMKIEPAP